MGCSVSCGAPGGHRSCWRRQAASQRRTLAAERTRAAGSGAPLSAPWCAGSPAPLCDPRRCARGGGAGWGWERSGGRGALLRSLPRPPAHWLGAAALWRAQREAPDGERRSTKGKPAGRQPCASLHQSRLGPRHLPTDRLLAIPGQGLDPSLILLLSMVTVSSQGGPRRLTFGEVQGLVISNTSYFGASVFLGP